MPRRPHLSTKQVLLRMSNFGPGGMIDLTSVDLTEADMANPELRALFRKYGSFSKESSAAFGLPYINLTGSDISGLDFSGIDVSNVIFSGVTARHTVFADCVMSDTQFDHACANYADFSRADLYHTKLYMTSLVGADFTAAKMKFTHGLGAPMDAISRLGFAHSIKDTVLPPSLEAIRGDIEKAIRVNVKRDKQKDGRFGFGAKPAKPEGPSALLSKKPTHPDDSGFSDV